MQNSVHTLVFSFISSISWLPGSPRGGFPRPAATSGCGSGTGRRRSPQGLRGGCPVGGGPSPQPKGRALPLPARVHVHALPCLLRLQVLDVLPSPQFLQLPSSFFLHPQPPSKVSNLEMQPNALSATVLGCSNAVEKVKPNLDGAWFFRLQFSYVALPLPHSRRFDQPHFSTLCLCSCTPL